MEWQPIETAPKDGTIIDLWVSKRIGPGDYAKPRRVPNMSWIDGRWFGPSRVISWDKITHWMPLPEPPKE